MAQVVLTAAFFLLVVFVARLRGAHVLGRQLLFYSNMSLLVYGVVIFGLLPLSSAFDGYLVNAGKSLFGAVQMLEDRLVERSAAPEHAIRVLAAYCFSIFWFLLSTAVVAGVSIGITQAERVLLSEREKQTGDTPWGFLLFSAVFILLMMYWLLFSQFLSSPLEPPGKRCWKTCSYLQRHVFPYFFKLGVLIYCWHFFMAILLKSVAWKLSRNKTEPGDQPA